MNPKSGPKSNPDLKVVIGDRIKFRREELFLTQMEVSKLLGVSRPQMSHMETGVNSPSTAIIPQLCLILQWTPNDLFGWEVKP